MKTLGISFKIDAAEYLAPCFDVTKLRCIVDSLSYQIKGTCIDFQVIAFAGVSGCLVAPACCVALNKYPFAVRRTSHESSHSSRLIEGVSGEFDYIIIDDLISSGETVQRIRSAADRNGGTLKALFFYNQDVETITPKNRFGVPLYYHWQGKWECMPAKTQD